MITMTYELLLQSRDGKPGKVVKWDGTDGTNAAERYVDMFRTESVVAWREVRHGLFVGAAS
jgi:hypothetical protein